MQPCEVTAWFEPPEMGKLRVLKWPLWPPPRPSHSWYKPTGYLGLRPNSGTEMSMKKGFCCSYSPGTSKPPSLSVGAGMLGNSRINTRGIAVESGRLNCDRKYWHTCGFTVTDFQVLAHLTSDWLTTGGSGMTAWGPSAQTPCSPHKRETLSSALRPLM